MMAETAYLASAFVTGALLLAVWALVARTEDWRSYDPAPAEDGRGRRRSDDAEEPVAAWAAGFFLLVLVVAGGAVLLVSDPAFAAAVGDWVALAAAFGALLLGFLVWGTYSSARFRGLQSAQAALLSAWVFGSLFVAVVAAKLVLAG
ncbi:hypothetical protein M0R89_18495 (plasmid) [Halorussus limi]|uniref:Uncharacterized protein n=1 Tax=Halorussus limi TaxID=2938695 RepID=A0A8U0I0H3_9EURY|nr:hypothetical protein [Halorussus limi]UPV76523.1 hypothetical protein M0R89_18495 [Halorussus limi]